MIPTETIVYSTSGAAGGRGLAGLVAAEQCDVQQCCAGARWKMRWSCWRWLRFSVLSPGRPRSTFDSAARPGILMSPLHLINCWPQSNLFLNSEERIKQTRKYVYCAYTSMNFSDFSFTYLPISVFSATCLVHLQNPLLKEL